MLLRYLKCRKNTESKKPKVVKAKNGRIIVTSNVWFAIVKIKIYQITRS